MRDRQSYSGPLIDPHRAVTGSGGYKKPRDLKRPFVIGQGFLKIDRLQPLHKFSAEIDIISIFSFFGKIDSFHCTFLCALVITHR